MFKLFEIFKNNIVREVIDNDGLYTVHELGEYYFDYKATIINSELIFIEDLVVDEKYIENRSYQILKTKPNRYFEDYFGFAILSINNEDFQFNILCEKLELNEIREMFLFLYEKNHLILNDFISKSSIGGSSIYQGKEYLYSSKYLTLISNFCEIFEQLYGNFRDVPHTVIRKNYKLSDYNNQTIDSRSIEWILQNLDSIDFDYSNKNYPDSINVFNNYGLIEKIGAEENDISFNTYENEIILGGFAFLQQKISELKRVIQAKLKRSNQIENSLYQQYIDFRDLKEIPFIKLLKDLDIIEERLFKLNFRYKRIFINVQPKNNFPKLTPVFYKYRHYQKAYNIIKLLRNSEYHLSDELQLLNVRKISELYELFNLNILVQVLDKMLSQDRYNKKVEYTDDTDNISYITYQNKTNPIKVIIYFKSTINNSSYKVGLITIGNFKLVSNHCSPDFIIKVINNNSSKFCILDSKYSKYNTIKYQHMPACVGKYIIDIGVVNDPFKKPEFLALLYPDKTASTQNIVYNSNFYPQMLMIVSKPSDSNPLEQFIHDFISETNEKI